MLVQVTAGRPASFPPTRLMNPVTYLGRHGHNDVVLDSENVSRRHAKLIVTDMGVTVHDLDSHNGVFINGKKVRSAALQPGDLLYVGDICVQLRALDDEFSGSASSVIRKAAAKNEEITGEEDPAVRNLAALQRAVDILVHEREAFEPGIVDLCRELCEANVAALVRQSDAGELLCDVVVHPGEAGRGLEMILQGVAKRCLDEGVPLFSPDLRKDPLVTDGSSDGACLCVPVLVDGQAVAAIYLSRPSPSSTFTERELETVGAVAHLVATREQKPAPLHSDGDDVVSLAAQAKIEAAQARLQEAQDDVRALTERVHGLEADHLKLKQQIEIEKQAAVDARREAERGRTEAQRLEQGLHKHDEEHKRHRAEADKLKADIEKLREALQKSEEERRARVADVEKLKEALRHLDEERRSRNLDLDKLKEALRAAEEALTQRGRELDATRTELDRAAAEITRLSSERREKQEELERVAQAASGEIGALRSAHRSLLPQAVADHVDAVASGGAPVTEAQGRAVTALYLTLRGFDSWASRAPAADVDARLDLFCGAIHKRATANGGRVDQVLGTGHLLVFGADPASVRAALRCAVEVIALVPTDVSGGVVAAVHTGTAVGGFFGDGTEVATHAEVGEPIVVATRAVDNASDAGVFFATDAVRAVLGGDPAFTLINTGPNLIKGVTMPVVLHVVTAAAGADGADGAGGVGGGAP